MITGRDIEELGHLKSNGVPVVSLYLNIDGSRATKKMYMLELRDLVKEARHKIESFKLDTSQAHQLDARFHEIELFAQEMKRNSAEPNWDLVEMKVAKPLAELQDRVSEEILRRTSTKSRVPLDRDPVPVEYQDAVRKYYERIGVGQ